MPLLFCSSAVLQKFAGGKISISKIEYIFDEALMERRWRIDEGMMDYQCDKYSVSSALKMEEVNIDVLELP